jgi:hypothetical protein
MVMSGPAHQGKDLARRVALDAAPAGAAAGGDRLAETQPVAALALRPGQRDVRQGIIARASRRSLAGHPASARRPVGKLAFRPGLSTVCRR